MKMMTMSAQHCRSPERRPPVISTSVRRQETLSSPKGPDTLGGEGGASHTIFREELAAFV